MPETVQASFFSEILKTAKDAATGNLMVYGKATGSDLDLDGQRMDPKWLAKAMPEWLPFGNVREQHGKIAAGVGRELTQKGDDWFLKAEIVDPGTIAKIEAGVLKGFSINVRDAHLSVSKAAPNGVIDAGFIGEISVVDRPCLPTATMSICKAAGADDALAVEDAPDAEIDPSLVDEEPDPFEDEDDEPVVPPVAPGTVEKTLGTLLERFEAMDAMLTSLNKRDFSRQQRDDAADSGAAMPDGSFPIKSEGDLANAVHLVGHATDPAAAKAHIRRRAAALGKKDPFDEAMTKALSGDAVDSLDKAVGGGVTSDQITKAVNEAVTKSVSVLEAKLSGLAAQIEKVMAMPMPGAPVIMGADPRTQPQTGVTPSRKVEYLAKAASVTDLRAREMWQAAADREPAA